jgi:hypothetical protein
VKNSTADIWKVIGFSGVISLPQGKIFFLPQEIYESPKVNHRLDIFVTHVSFEMGPYHLGNEFQNQKWNMRE